MKKQRSGKSQERRKRRKRMTRKNKKEKIKQRNEIKWGLQSKCGEAK